MIISQILGGLGNQMFQYALGRALALRNKDVLKLDISAFDTYTLRDFSLNNFNTHCKLASANETAPFLKNKRKKRGLRRLVAGLTHDSSKQYVCEQGFAFDPSILELTGDLYLSGYWQTEKYFAEFREQLLKDFSLRERPGDRFRHFANVMADRQAVSLHIRRGDYVSDPNTLQYHGVCPLDYYREAVARLQRQREGLTYFVFSDDIPWAQANLEFIPDIVFVSGAADLHDYEEMTLMSLCQHNIIANSSFSWWGAWLNRRDDKTVIAPSRWFNVVEKDTRDLIPNSWVRL